MFSLCFLVNQKSARSRFLQRFGDYSTSFQNGISESFQKHCLSSVASLTSHIGDISKIFTPNNNSSETFDIAKRKNFSILKTRLNVHIVCVVYSQFDPNKVTVHAKFLVLSCCSFSIAN